MPLTEAHRRGVADPMSASLLRVPGNGSTFVPQVCQRTVAVFDGRMRYDLQLAFNTEYSENDIFPTTDITEDWLKLIDYDPENVVKISPVRAVGKPTHSSGVI